MAFVVDGSEWHFDGWSADEVAASIELMLERVSTAQARREAIWIGDDLQTRPVLGEFDIWSLFSPESPLKLSPELRQELAAWLGKALRYADENVWPDGMEETIIRVDCDPAIENIDVAWAHHNVRNRRAVACLSIRRSGPHQTVSGRGVATIYWINCEENHKNFWRSAIDVEGNNEETLQSIAPHAFPNLYFYPAVWRGLRSLVGGYYALSFEIRRYLSILDDYGGAAFTCPPPALSPAEFANSSDRSCPPNQLVEQRFEQLNLSMAPEKPNVYNNSRCRQAREVQIGPRTLYCEWHGKLEPHQNRLYLHPPIPECGDKIVIAIFHPHLPLPGDN
ncbi:hypothetical protein [Methylosinus sp. PW1]|uniref:hypothetical protein n=1 Tax=Methylosinus sp. PW1 TaxID=107636 RepID=UPI0012EB8A89|nr:hypothetical protein [Methylosinus sp. PW1]